MRAAGGVCCGLLTGLEVVLELGVWGGVGFLAFCEVLEVEFCEDFFGNWDGLGWWLWWLWLGVRVVVDLGNWVGRGGEVCPTRGEWGSCWGRRWKGCCRLKSLSARWMRLSGMPNSSSDESSVLGVGGSEVV